MSNLIAGRDATICAPITAYPGPVAVVRISGSNAWAAAQTLVDSLQQEPGRVQYGRLAHGDDGYITLFEQGHSFTGERVAEVSGHGSHAAVEGLLQWLQKQGVRLALPGEFSFRAFVNGRIDLAHAEGIHAAVAAEGERQMRHAERLQQGALSDRIAEIRDGLTHALAMVEAATDFEEETGPLDRKTCGARLEDAAGRIRELLAGEGAARALHTGWRVAILGKPNAGKSSLLNALAQEERALVTAHAGTTRDAVEARLIIAGVPVTFVDTAGLRSTEDAVETLGIERARREAEHADLRIFLQDSQEHQAQPAEYVSLPEPKMLWQSKSDLTEASSPQSVSAKTGAGIDDMVRAIAESLPADASVPLVPRHLPVLRSALQAIEEARAALSTGMPSDLAAVGIQSAARSLGEITGETAGTDLIAQLFGGFCIGK